MTARGWACWPPLLALVLLGCGARPSAEAAYDKLVAEGVRYLDAQMETNRRVFRIDSYPRYDWSQEAGELVFSDGGVPKVIATTQVVGDFGGTSKTWLWAWANDSIDKQLAVDAERVRRYGQVHGMDRLTRAEWSTTLNDGWCLTSITALLSHAKGAYRMPDKKGGALYLVFTDVRWARGGAAAAAKPVQRQADPRALSGAHSAPKVR
jgi:hypothetical protein